MKLFNISSYILLFFSLCACSNTAQINLTNKSNLYNQNTSAKHFTHSDFSINKKYTFNKSARSDQQLMLALLNRPVPEDQRMMLELANKKTPYFSDNSRANIEIKGIKKTDNFHRRATSHYALVIEQDINAVSINVMR